MSVSQMEIAREDQVMNNAGGFVFALSDMQRLRRFLILGSDGGTYYCKATELTQENAECILRLLADGKGSEVVDEVRRISVEGRAPKQEPTLFALAMCARASDVETRRQALQALSEVCRIPTHLFTFIGFMEAMGKSSGWGRLMRRSVANWYVDKEPVKLAFLTTKYQNRNGWSHCDLLRLAHPTPKSQAQQLLFMRITKGFQEAKEAMPRLLEVAQAKGGAEATEDVQQCQRIMALLDSIENLKDASTEEEVVEVIREQGLVREQVPSKWLNSVLVWQALLEKMPMTAMVRNLGKMTSIGLFDDEACVKHVVDCLNNEEAIKKARLHPFSVLLASTTYQQGHGERGKLTWSPCPPISDALDAAFYKAFKSVKPTGKRLLLALDVSGSMGWSNISNTNVSAMLGAAAMSMVALRTEQNARTMGFSHELVDVDLRPDMTLDEVVATMGSIPMGGTDCALPMVWAKQHGIEVDAFVVYTDCETWCGEIHPYQALQDYRAETGIPAKLVVVGMTSSGFTIADPTDAGMMDVVGFDAAAPNLMADFIADRL